jgi:hypothetical protein
MPSYDAPSSNAPAAPPAISEWHREVRPLQTAELHLLRPARDIAPNIADTPGDVAMLRALLAERESRLAEKNGVIIELRQRVIVAEAERRMMARQLIVRAAAEPVQRRRKGTFQALGRLLDFCAEMMLPPPPIPEKQPRIEPDGAHDAARSITETLLEQIARHQRHEEK